MSSLVRGPNNGPATQFFRRGPLPRGLQEGTAYFGVRKADWHVFKGATKVTSRPSLCSVNKDVQFSIFVEAWSFERGGTTAAHWAGTLIATSVQYHSIQGMDFSACSYCHRQELASETARCQSKTEKLQAESRQIEENLQTRLSFLALQFDHEKADEIPKPDVLIVVDDGDSERKILYTHALILACRSPVFRKMLEVDMLEKERGEIHIKDATFPVVSAVIKFCVAEIHFSEEITCEDVLEVAHKYAIGALFKVCEDDLVRTIDSVSLPRRLKVAKKFEAKGLQAAALAYLKKYFDDVIVAVVDEVFWPWCS